MTIGYHDVRAWDAEELDTVAVNLAGRRDKLIRLQDELDDAKTLPAWRGTASERVRSSLGNTRNNAEILVAELSAVEYALQSASDDVSALKRRVADNDYLAGTYQFTIAADGAIVDDKPADPLPMSLLESEQRAVADRHRASIRKQLEQETKAILDTARGIDAALARVMQLALDRKIRDHGATTLADASKAGKIDARMVEMEQALRDAGLLTGPSASGYYRQWLENAVRRRVSIDTIVKIAAEHRITPEDFEILDGMKEIREDEDGDGIFKSYFLLPTDISADDATKAVRMTYLLNAGTDYGTEGETTDFGPVPYGSGALWRIADRQRQNSWSYHKDVGFVHDNGGRIVTTPNGIMMGLGGNVVQDQFSQGGGTTWGDMFMLDIDNPKDPAPQLREVAKSGQVWGEGADGPFRGELDMDRLLHHEERHSRQWAHEGGTAFLASYLWERVTGGNETEEDAGLSDGGYR
ncbi:hypothetical protein [Nocardia goodfellowii]|uniref:WXG100 family type VII secretion target n=1 Tax=Nocardia goodfellowii TaxID=882446 RepID=A0ABS4QMV2_9NOCA|nr:hypothetical protein [Nocardia goodfellowii]MBP2193030.1 hypothetical protein [Nocardia goodfellowii]